LACLNVSICSAKCSNRVAFDAAADCRKVSVLLIADALFLNAGGGVGLAQVAALHGHTVQPVGQAGQLRALELGHGHQLNACRLQSLLVGGEVGAVLGGCVGQLLELLAGAGLASADCALDLALGRRFALGLDARGHTLQAEIPLNLSHDGFLPLVVLAVADDLARVGDSVGQDVDVLVLGVGVPGHDELVICEAHPAQIALPDGLPLLVCELFAGGGG
jgi:hypothetical protein